MRCTHLFLSALVCAATPVFARPVPVPKPMPLNQGLHFDLSGVHFFQQPSSTSTDFIPWDQHAETSHALSLPKIGVGPLHAEFGVDDNPRANLSTYKMQGGDQLGSSVWQAERGKSAKLMFTWPPEK